MKKLFIFIALFSLFFVTAAMYIMPSRSNLYYSMGKGNQLKLLIQSNTTDGSTTFTDTSGQGHTITEVQGDGSVQHDTAQKKFDASSMLFDGTNGSLSIADHADWYTSTGTLTIHFWIRFNSLPVDGDPASNIGILNQKVDAEHRHAVYFYQTGANYYLRWVCRNDNGGTVYIINKGFGPIAISTGAWFHFALIRGWAGDANTVAVTMNGTLIETDTVSGSVPDLAASLVIGDVDGAYADGWIEEFHFINGLAVWTSDFIPSRRASN